MLEPDGNGGFGVLFPDFPGCVTVGKDTEEAGANAIEALILHIEGMLEDGLELPEASSVDEPLPEWLDEVDTSKAVRMLVPVEVGGKIIRINITIEEGLLARITAVADIRGMSRSAFFADAARRSLCSSAPRGSGVNEPTPHPEGARSVPDRPTRSTKGGSTRANA
jgi:predicted RNase H-like HicB family nuclease